MLVGTSWESSTRIKKNWWGREEPGDDGLSQSITEGKRIDW